MILKRFHVAFIALAFCFTLAVSESYAQRGKYWRGDNGRNYDRYESNRERGWVETYRSSPRRYTGYYPRSYSYPRYVSYPRFVRYRSYPRYTNYYPSYNTYNSYRIYPRYRRYQRSGISIRLGW